LAQNLKIVTTSWDDGDVRDVKIAEMLASHGMSGTFYVPIKPFNGNPSLSVSQMRSMIAGGFEIGGHTINHEILTEVPVRDLDHIVTTCKKIHEDNLGERLRMFCYPRGRYTRHTVTALEKAGYEGARTVELLATDTISGLYDLPTSIQVYRHTRTEYLRNIVRVRAAKRLFDYVGPLGFGDDWIDLGKKLFHRVLENGGVWHLWGHSWEIDEMGLWDEMREMLAYVSGRDDVLYLNNGDMVQQLTNTARLAVA
jgi:peptidoglycan/xylan/chitin deacetylase (PgdA/CDA1 family)